MGWKWFALFSLALLFGCKKEKDGPTGSAQMDGREQFVGEYKVYDTTGTYLYSMEIMKSSLEDKLFVSNWGNSFDVYVWHDEGDLTSFFNFGVYQPAYDRDGQRWSVSHEFDEGFQSNHLVNDTLRMSYFKSNIAYFFEDGVPFFEWSYREYGVKQ